jgi:hypothetical protein
MLSSAADVWQFLKSEGGLQLKHYDSELPIELLASLKKIYPQSTSTDLDTLLKKTSVSVEDFLIAFFTVVQPFAEMLVDLLRFFEEAKANQGKENLRVKFNFDKDLPPLSFDLEHFRKWQEAWRQVTGTFVVNIWNSNSLWGLNGVLRSRDVRVGDVSVQTWLAEYYEGSNRRGAWPAVEPPPPRSGVRDLDLLLEKVWRVWRTVVRESVRYGTPREDLRRVRYPNSGVAAAEEEGEERWPGFLLAGLDSDHWAGSLIEGMYTKAEYISRVLPGAREAEAHALSAELSKVLDTLPTTEITGSTMERTLEDFLNLPVWQRRYEVYSAWIVTQIVDALRDQNVVIHSVDGELLFEFKGTHLATFGTFPDNLHLMAEVRTPLSNPLGFGRKKGMQPDYSVFTSPITSPKSSVLEVECKQYLVASRKKFAQALTDYANGRPNAEVILVNYGSAPTQILDLVPDAVRSRTHVVGLLRPRSTTALIQFADLVRKAVSRRSAINQRASIVRSAPTALRGALKRIALEWKDLPRDLDLTMWIAHPAESYLINYMNKGSSSDKPWARLDDDMRQGRGRESIYIEQWIDGWYGIAVHNYSEDAELAGCGATVLLVFEQEKLWWLSLKCPALGSGAWWKVLRYWPPTGEIQIIDRIVTSVVAEDWLRMS